TPHLLHGHGIGAYTAATLTGTITPTHGYHLATLHGIAHERLRAVDESDVAAVTWRPATLPMETDLPGLGSSGTAPSGLLDHLHGRVNPPAEESDHLTSAVRIDLTARPDPDALGAAWRSGVAVRWDRIMPGAAPHLDLPSYPFQHRTHWIGGGAQRQRTGPVAEPLAPALIRHGRDLALLRMDLAASRIPFLAEHRVHGELVVPGVLLTELTLRAARALIGDDAIISAVEIGRPLVVGPDADVAIHVVARRSTPTTVVTELYVGEDSETLHLQTTCRTADDVPVTFPRYDLRGESGHPDDQLDRDDAYRRWWHPAFVLGPSLRLVDHATRAWGTSTAEIVPPPDQCSALEAGIAPELLMVDAAIQLVAMAADGRDHDRPVHLGAGYRALRVNALNADGPLLCRATMTGMDPSGFVGDLVLTDPAGRTAAEIDGVAFRRVTPDLLARVRHDAASPSGVDGPELGSSVRAEILALPSDEILPAVLQHLRELLARILGSTAQEVDADADIIELTDSLMLVELSQDLHDSLEVTVEVADLFDSQTVRRLAQRLAADLLAESPTGSAAREQDQTGSEPVRPQAEPVVVDRPAEPPSGSRTASPTDPSNGQRSTLGTRIQIMSVAELDDLARLDSTIVPVGTAPSNGHRSPGVLLTGGTGFIGAFLLAEVLRRYSGPVICLVRAESVEMGRRRIASNLAQYGLSDTPGQDRLEVVTGDLEQPGLGLTPGEFAGLSDRIGTVFHNAATVKWTYPYRSLAGANVHGTREILRLATTGTPKTLHYTSTVGVFCSREDRRERAREDDDLLGSGPLAVGYAQSKWVAERMVVQARDRGLPVTVHRVNTGGHSQTGAFNRLDHLSMLIKGCIEARLAPTDANMPLQPAPVDYVAGSIVALSTDPDFAGHVSHLVNPTTLSWLELFDHVEAAGYPIERVGFDEWRQHIVGRRSGTMALLGLVPFLNDTVDHVRLPVSDCSATQHALAKHGISCPPLDRALVDTFLHGFQQRGFIPAPRHSGPATERETR
ncbi:MAG TPA: thioester reductase domain-containing protein, partial [Microlunatus sp.]|nr:thioester reductase domain-containing protein [Microlunatus sp.]